MKIGIIADLLGKPLFESLALAKQLGADGVQLYAVGARWNLMEYSANELAAVAQECKNLGLAVTAVCGDLGGHAFQFRHENPERIRKTKQIFDIAEALGAKVVTGHIGVIPEDASCERFAILCEALKEVAAYASSKGMAFAIETGPEHATTLKQFLTAVNDPGLGINYDPANLKMVLDEDVVKGVEILEGHIVHTHAKDGIHYKKCDPVIVYNAFAEGGFEKLLESTGQLFAEMPLGKGQVPWNEYIAALKKIGYDSWLTIEREVGADPVKDISDAVNFLKEITA